MHKIILTDTQIDNLIHILKNRFLENIYRHKNIEWANVESQLKLNLNKLWSLNEMELTGGQPDVVDCIHKEGDPIIFCDCSKESPKGRRSLCYDREALNARKEHKPANSAMDLAETMQVEMLTLEQYYRLQTIEPLDTKSSSWVLTPESIRKQNGALFAEYRYGQVFVFHNGASSYYSSRGFRALLSL